MSPITYTSEQPTEYSKALTACASLGDLVALLTDYKELAADALTIAQGMTDADWLDFARGLKSERRGRFAGMHWFEKYAAIVMPEVMTKAAMIASEYKVPWGLAYIRLRDSAKEAA